jgi:flagellar export protein FliJ
MAFRLARVLRLRTQLRERAQEDVAQGAVALAGAKSALAEVQAAADSALATEAAAATGGITGEDLHRSRAWASALAAREQELKQETSRLADVLQRLRATLVARRREERQLEILREQVNDRQQEAEERTTATLLDDLARRKKP